MASRHFGFGLAAALALQLAGCNGSGTKPVANSIQATPSTQTAATAVGGNKQTLGITFVSSNGEPIHNLSVSGLANLPSGWSGPASFSCATVTTGSGCVLDLSYAPSAVGSGTLSLTYSFTNALGDAVTSTVAVPYSATSHDNVVTSAAPTGQIAAIVGNGSQTVTVTFTTDDGQAASGLTVTSSLSGLPAGWNSAATSFSCPGVSTGNGCQLALTFAPQVASSGSLTISYSYTDNAGEAKTGSALIAYAATTHDNLVATAGPTGQINAVVGSGSQAVTITFTTDDGQAASGLALTSLLSALPAGWSSTATSFDCASVSTGNGCQLELTYAPQAADSGTLTLNYGYTDNAGAAKTGSASIAYAATIHDNVVATAAPTGQINAIAGSGSQSVTLTFTTDDGQAASALALSSLVSALPAGWSSTATSFSCASVSTGSGCQLALTFAPVAAGNGTLTLNYGYTDNAHTAKTGSASIAYAATTADNVAGTVSPTGQVTTLAGGSGTNVNLTFATDDGSPASNLAITAGLVSLPNGWSGPASFSCATISAGSACRLTLAYAPQYTGSASTLTLNYSYTDNAGNAKTGTQNISYLATGPHLYIANLVTELDACDFGAGGALSTCTATPASSGPAEPSGIAFNGNTAYIADFGSSAIDVCAVNADGILANCAAYSSFPTNWTPWSLTVATAGNGNTYLYATDENSLYGNVQQCSLAADGNISGCVQTAPGIVFGSGLAIGGGYAYIGTLSGSYVVDVCTYNTDGSITGCVSTGSGFNTPSFITINNNYVYVVDEGSGKVSVCTVGTGGALTSCPTSTLPGAPMTPTQWSSTAATRTSTTTTATCGCAPSTAVPVRSPVASRAMAETASTCRSSSRSTDMTSRSAWISSA